MKNIKIKPFKVQVTPEQSKEIQELLISAGRGWPMPPYNEVRHVSAHCLVLDKDQDITYRDFINDIPDGHEELLHPHEAVARIKEAIKAAEPEEWYILLPYDEGTMGSTVAYRFDGQNHYSLIKHDSEGIIMPAGILAKDPKRWLGNPCTKEEYYALLNREGTYLHDLTADHRIKWRDMHPDNKAEIEALPKGQVQSIADFAHKGAGWYDVCNFTLGQAPDNRTCYRKAPTSPEPQFEAQEVTEHNMERSGFFISTFIMREDYAGVSQDGGTTWHPLPLRNDLGTIEPKITHIRFIK